MATLLPFCILLLTAFCSFLARSLFLTLEGTADRELVLCKTLLLDFTALRELLCSELDLLAV